MLTRTEQLEELDHERTHLEELRAAIKHQLHGLALEAVTLDKKLESRLALRGLKLGDANAADRLSTASSSLGSMTPAAAAFPADMRAVAAAAAAVVAAATAGKGSSSTGAGTGMTDSELTLPAMADGEGSDAESDDWLSPRPPPHGGGVDTGGGGVGIGGGGVGIGGIGGVGGGASGVEGSGVSARGDDASGSEDSDSSVSVGFDDTDESDDELLSTFEAYSQQGNSNR